MKYESYNLQIRNFKSKSKDKNNTKSKFKTMKNNYLKWGVLALTMIAGGAVQAQTDPSTTDTAKQTGVVYGAGQQGGSIRVIDNKGTIKYLQSNNGITTVSNTTANGDVTTTTWQLGGTLSSDTDIDLAGNVFSLDQVLEVDPTAMNAPATDIAATTTSVVAGANTGWTILVRDEATGAIKKLKATSLIQSGREEFTATAAQTAYVLTGNPVLPAFAQVYVYRNGAKLRASVDYTVAVSTVTLIPGTTPPNDWAVYADDIIEVHYIK